MGEVVVWRVKMFPIHAKCTYTKYFTLINRSSSCSHLTWLWIEIIVISTRMFSKWKTCGSSSTSISSFTNARRRLWFLPFEQFVPHRRQLEFCVLFSLSLERNVISSIFTHLMSSSMDDHTLGTLVKMGTINVVFLFCRERLSYFRGLGDHETHLWKN